MCKEFQFVNIEINIKIVYECTVQFGVSSVVRLAILECCSWQKMSRPMSFAKYIKKKTFPKYVYVVRVTFQCWEVNMENFFFSFCYGAAAQREPWTPHS